MNGTYQWTRKHRNGIILSDKTLAVNETPIYLPVALLEASQLTSKPATITPPPRKNVKPFFGGGGRGGFSLASMYCCNSASPPTLTAGEQHPVHVVTLRRGQRVESQAPQRVDHAARTSIFRSSRNDGKPGARGVNITI